MFNTIIEESYNNIEHNLLENLLFDLFDILNKGNNNDFDSLI